MNERSRAPATAELSQPKFWRKSYPLSTPLEIDLAQLPTLKALCELACARYGDSPAFVEGDRSLTFKELEILSRSFGAWLHSVGLRKGDRVALMLPNALEYPIALFGALRAGMVVVNLNPLYTQPEVEQLLCDSASVVLVTLVAGRHAADAYAIQRVLRYVVAIGSADIAPDFRTKSTENACCHIAWREVVQPSSGTTLNGDLVEPNDLAFIQYTGGTTASPKGVMLTHRNVCANILQSVAWIHAYTGAQRTLATLLPLYHIFALEGSLLLFTHLGWRNVLVADARHLPAVVAELARYRISLISGVNTLFRGLLNTPAFDAGDFSQLEITLSGGMAADPAVARRWQEVTGCHLTQAWGLTETSPAACINPPGLPFNGSVGLPIPSTEIAIKDETGRDLPIGEVGEICVRGPQVMSGYWRRREETVRALWPDGWLRTGDAGRFDEKGFVYLVERIKDVIVVSGFKVYPQEVEAVAARYPGVIEAAATAQFDAESGECVALFVVCADAAIREADLVRHCRHSLAPYKVPKHIFFRTELPKSAVGKTLRKVLREELSKPLVE